jgi:hypothetical protein
VPVKRAIGVALALGWVVILATVMACAEAEVVR